MPADISNSSISKALDYGRDDSNKHTISKYSTNVVGGSFRLLEVVTIGKNIIQGLEVSGKEGRYLIQFILG